MLPITYTSLRGTKQSHVSRAAMQIHPVQFAIASCLAMTWGIKQNRPCNCRACFVLGKSYCPPFLASCIGLVPDVAPLGNTCCLNNSNLDGAYSLGQLLLLSSISAVSRYGSSLIPFTSLLFANTLVILFSFLRQM